MSKEKEKLFELLIKSGEFTPSQMIELAILCGQPTDIEFKTRGKIIKQRQHKDGISQEAYTNEK